METEQTILTCEPDNQTTPNFVSDVNVSLPLVNSHSKMTIKKLAIFLPIAYRGGSLNGAKNIAKMLHKGSRHHNESVEIVFSYVGDSYDIEEDFSDLTQMGIQVRQTEWRIMNRDEVELTSKFLAQNPQLNYDNYSYPYDNIANFNDCDFWLIISDRTIQPIAPIKPYGMVIYDYIQRYLPETFGSYYEEGYIASSRAATFVLTTTPATRADAIQYAGVDHKRVHLMPMEFNPFRITPNPSSHKKDYFIWSTNTASHKNHIKAIDALNAYYNDLNGTLDVLMTGFGTKLYDFNDTTQSEIENPYIKKVRNLLASTPSVANRLVCMGNLNTSQYISTLASAKFLWHPAIIDNGTYSLVEAAYYGVPSLSSYYPQTAYMNERFKLNSLFFNPLKTTEMAASLKTMEQEYKKRSQDLPTKEFLDTFSWEALAPDIWKFFRNLL